MIASCQLNDIYNHVAEWQIWATMPSSLMYKQVSGLVVLAYQHIGANRKQPEFCGKATSAVYSIYSQLLQVTWCEQGGIEKTKCDLNQIHIHIGCRGTRVHGTWSTTQQSTNFCHILSLTTVINRMNRLTHSSIDCFRIKVPFFRIGHSMVF